jgi:hypothetical protein
MIGSSVAGIFVASRIERARWNPTSIETLVVKEKTARHTAVPCRCAEIAGPISNRANILGVGTFRTTTFRELDFLTLVKVVESRPLHSGHVEEQVLPRASVDETETFVCQFLDRPLRHLAHL